MIEVTDKTWEEEVLNSEIPVFVDFWAPWCGPCKMVGPIFEDVSKKYEGEIKFVKLNVDDNPETTDFFGIKSIPTFIILKNGSFEAMAVGAASEDRFIAMADKVLGRD